MEGIPREQGECLRVVVVVVVMMRVMMRVTDVAVAIVEIASTTISSSRIRKSVRNQSTDEAAEVTVARESAKGVRDAMIKRKRKVLMPRNCVCSEII
jgi:hypothetical protein